MFEIPLAPSSSSLWYVSYATLSSQSRMRQLCSKYCSQFYATMYSDYNHMQTMTPCLLNTSWKCFFKWNLANKIQWHIAGEPWCNPNIFTTNAFASEWEVPTLTKRYHALRRLPQKVHLRISPNGIADICTREDSETIGITMDIFLFLSSLEARHVIFLCEGHHFVFWGWSSCRQSRI